MPAVRRTVAATQTAYLRLRAVGALPLSYQWSFQGTNLPGASFATLTNSANYPSKPAMREFITSFECLATNWETNYGTRVIGFLRAPTTGNYTFAVSGEDEARAAIWLERFAEVMRRDGRVEVTTASDLAHLLGLERQKQLLGCDSEATSCLAELANALGTEGVLVGSITRSGNAYLAVLKVIRQKNGSVWWSSSARVRGEPALLDWLDDQAAASVSAMFPRSALPAGPLVLGGAGIVAVGVGATFVILSNTVALEAVRSAPSEQALATALDQGRTQSDAGCAGPFRNPVLQFAQRPDGGPW